MLILLADKIYIHYWSLIFDDC